MDEWREEGLPPTYALNIGDDWNVQVSNRSSRKGYIIAGAVKTARARSRGSPPGAYSEGFSPSLEGSSGT